MTKKASSGRPREDRVDKPDWNPNNIPKKSMEHSSKGSVDPHLELRRQAENNARQRGHILIGWVRRFGLWITKCSQCGIGIIVDREKYGTCCKLSWYFRPKISHPIIECGSSYEDAEGEYGGNASWDFYDYGEEGKEIPYEYRHSVALNEYHELIGDKMPGHVNGFAERKRRIQMDREGGRIIKELIELEKSASPATQAKLIKIMNKRYKWSADRTKKQIKRCYNKGWLEKEYGENDKHRLICYLKSQLTTDQLNIMRSRMCLPR